MLPESAPSVPAESGVWRFDDFVLDTPNYELRSGETVIRVEPQVFDVMAQLVANHERVVTKEELFDSVLLEHLIDGAHRADAPAVINER